MGKALTLCIASLLAGQIAFADQVPTFVFNESNHSEQQNISVHFEKEPLTNVLQELARKVNVDIFYNTVVVPSKLVTYRAERISMFKIFDAVLEGTGLHASLSENRKVISIKQKQVGPTVKQETITGTVTDASSGTTLPGVNIQVKGTTMGTSTDENGAYELTVESLQDTLVFSFVGYESQTVPINGRTSIDAMLKVNTQQLDEMVVTGFGEVSQEQFTGSASQISGEEIEAQPITSPNQALKGAATGLRMTTSSGTPGGAAQINIRGVSSINASTDPLYIIDGTPVRSGQLEQTGGSMSTLGALSTIDPSDIKSMTVLKGASATAQYGARGSNGVIVIETKEGAANDDTHYSFSIQRGGSQRAVDGPQPLNAEQFTELYTEALVNSGVDRSNITPPDNWNGQTDTDWGDLITRDQAIGQKFSFSASGGTDRTTFFSSLNYNKKEGANIGSGFKRIGGRLNFGYDFSKAANLDNKFNASYVKQNGVEEGASSYSNPMVAMYEMRPTISAYNENGTPNITEPGQTISLNNPMYYTYHDINRKQVYRIINNTTFNLNLLENLAFSSQLGLDYLTTEEKFYDNPIHGDGDETNGQIQPNYSRNFNFTWKNSFDYIWDLNQNNELNFKVLQEANKNLFYTSQTSAQNFSTTGLSNAASAGTPTSVYSFADDWSSLAFLGNVRYSFKDKYNLQASFRYEGNSRFADGQRWGSFFSLGGAWILTEESFLDGSENWLDLLKLRGSYGKTGNAGIGINQYQTFLGYGGAYSGRGAIGINQLGNPDLTWEKATSYEVGINAGLFNNRVTTDATFFRKNSEDLLLNVPLSYTTGHSSQIRNLGNLYNQGVELSLNVDVLQNQNITWSLGGKYTKVKNEVTSLPEDGNGNPITLTDYNSYIGVEGYRVNGWYLRTWAGVNPENGRPLWYRNVTDTDGNVTGRTTTSDYNEATRYYQDASPMPTDYGSINTNLSVKGVFIDAMLTYTFGNKVWDVWADYMQSDGRNSLDRNQLLSVYKDRWQEPGDQAKNPQVIAGGNMQSGEPSSRWLYRGDYLRLQNVRIGYNIPSSLLSRLHVGLSSFTIYFSGRNLWTYTYDDDLKWDPEVRQDGDIDFTALPLKTYSFGIKANF